MENREIRVYGLNEAERSQDGDWLGDEASVELFFTQSHRASWNFGPLLVEVRLSAAGLELEIYLSGVHIGGGTLSDEDELCVSAQVALVKTKTCLQADFAQQELWVSGEA